MVLSKILRVESEDLRPTLVEAGFLLAIIWYDVYLWWDFKNVPWNMKENKKEEGTLAELLCNLLKNKFSSYFLADLFLCPWLQKPLWIPF